MFEGLAVDEIQSLIAQETENREDDQMPSESVRKFSFSQKVLQVLGYLKMLCDKRAWRAVSFLTKNTWTIMSQSNNNSSRL